MVFGSLNGQVASFDSYNKITNSEFADFLNLFEKRSLPISTDDVLTEVDLRNLKGTSLDQEQITRYLVDEGELIPPSLYTSKTDPNLAENEVYGEFIPMFKLPTNGDYVLLVVAQIDIAFLGYDMVFVLSYDLEGNFLYFTNYLYEAGTENINNSVDENLKSHQTYVINDVNGELIFPPLEGVFEALEAHSVEQINSDGRSAKILFETTSGQFEWVSSEFRFKRVQ